MESRRNRQDQNDADRQIILDNISLLRKKIDCVNRLSVNPDFMDFTSDVKATLENSRRQLENQRIEEGKSLEVQAVRIAYLQAYIECCNRFLRSEFLGEALRFEENKLKEIDLVEQVKSESKGE